MEVVRNKTLSGWLIMVLLLLIGIFFWLIAGATYERYEVSRIERCTKVVGSKYYQSKTFGIKSEPQKYYILADGREVLAEDAWRYMEFDVKVTNGMALLTKSKGLNCDYVYKKIKKPNISLNLEEPTVPR